jgi:hypothetical protein
LIITTEKKSKLGIPLKGKGNAETPRLLRVGLKSTHYGEKKKNWY